MTERASQYLILTLTWHTHQKLDDDQLKIEYTPYVNGARVDKVVMVWRTDRMVNVSRVRDENEHVVSTSGYIHESERDAFIRKAFKLKAGDEVRYRQRFTHYVPCEDCGAMIFATRIKPGSPHYWANLLDCAPHSCADFKDRLTEVQRWSKRKKNTTRHYRSSERNTTD